MIWAKLTKIPLSLRRFSVKLVDLNELQDLAKIRFRGYTLLGLSRQGEGENSLDLAAVLKAMESLDLNESQIGPGDRK
jgi:hypothetical protein